MDRISKDNALPQKKTKIIADANSANNKNINNLRLLLLIKVNDLKLNYAKSRAIATRHGSNYLTDLFDNLTSLHVKIVHNGA